MSEETKKRNGEHTEDGLDELLGAEIKSRPTVFDVMRKVDDLIGAEEFKKVMYALEAMIPVAKKKDLLEVLFFGNYVFSIDSGCGFTTCVNLLASLLDAAGMQMVEANDDGVYREDSLLRKFGTEEGKWVVKCVDISEELSSVDKPKFRELLMKYRETADRTVYIFRVPTMEDELLDRVCDSISDILYVEKVRFKSLSYDEMRQYAQRLACSMGFRFDASSDDAFDKAITEEKMDGRFYGFNTVKKVVQEIIFRKLARGVKANKKEVTLDFADVDAVLKKKKILSGDELLDRLDGMESVKEQIREIVDQISYMHDKKVGEIPCIHMRFVGNPGTGKTTVARIVGRMLAERGVLKNGAFNECSGRDLVAKYVGHTEEKVREICAAAYGSVLFIDEAYALYMGDSPEHDFGIQAMAVLITEMENHRNDMVVIMAGYSDEMENLMRSNKGLESRMPYKIVFNNYTKDELTRIFMNMAKEYFETECGLEKTVEEFFASLPKSFLEDKTFGNGRYVRNLFERTQKNAISRSIKEKAEKVIITCADFDEATAEEGFTPKRDGASAEENSIGF